MSNALGKIVNSMLFIGVPLPAAEASRVVLNSSFYSALGVKSEGYGFGTFQRVGGVRLVITPDIPRAVGL